MNTINTKECYNALLAQKLIEEKVTPVSIAVIEPLRIRTALSGLIDLRKSPIL